VMTSVTDIRDTRDTGDTQIPTGIPRYRTRGGCWWLHRAHLCNRSHALFRLIVLVRWLVVVGSGRFRSVQVGCGHAASRFVRDLAALQSLSE
jgi:hypothetical protein